jgi:hypothetical protein
MSGNLSILTSVRLLSFVVRTGVSSGYLSSFDFYQAAQLVDPGTV